MVTADVVGLYSSIPEVVGLEVLRKALDNRENKKISTDNLTKTQVLCKFKPCWRRVGDSRWWGSLTMVQVKRLSSVNRTTKQFIIIIIIIIISSSSSSSRTSKSKKAKTWKHQNFLHHMKKKYQKNLNVLPKDMI